MSLDLDTRNKKGVHVGHTAITTAAGFVTAIFTQADAEKANQLGVKVDTSGGDVDLTNLPAPSTIPYLEDGDTVYFQKVTTDANKIIIDLTSSPNITSQVLQTLAFVGQALESYSLEVDLPNDTFIFIK